MWGGVTCVGAHVHLCERMGKSLTGSHDLPDKKEASLLPLLQQNFPIMETKTRI